jgi:hypothetical protein
MPRATRLRFLDDYFQMRGGSVLGFFKSLVHATSFATESSGFWQLS